MMNSGSNLGSLKAMACWQECSSTKVPKETGGGGRSCSEKVPSSN